MATTTTLKPGRVEQLPLGALAPDPDQPRTAIDDDALQTLAANIKARGILQPILVRPGTKGKKGVIIVDGERRWRAARLAKLRTVPVMLHAGDASSVGLRVDQVAANNLRQALTPMDLARFLRRLRDVERMPASGIAATLEQHGLKAMTRQEVETQLQLTDLPDWAQSMIDDRTLELSAAPIVAKATRYPAILKEFRKAIAQRVGWAGRVVPREAESALAGVMTAQFANLTKVATYHDDPVRFDHRKRCKGCEHYAVGSHFAVCTSARLFGEHQAEAKAAGLGPGGSRPQPETKASAATVEKQKAEQRERSIENTATEYLTRYLVRRLDEALAIDMDLCHSLVLWAAAWRPGGRWLDRMPQRIIEMFSRERAEEHRKWRALADFLTMSHSLERDAAIYLIARQVKDCLNCEHLALIAGHVWGPDLGKFWAMDGAFPKLFRKAELVHQLEACGAELPEGRKSWDAMKTGELQDALLRNAEKIGVPQILQDLYARKPRPDGGEEREDTAEHDEVICIGCGYWEYAPCDGGGGWLVTEGNRGICSAAGCKAGHLPRWNAGDRSLSDVAEELTRERGDFDDEGASGPDDDIDDMDDAA